MTAFSSYSLLPTLVVHADWGSDPKKRWMAKAVLKEDGYFWASTPEPVGEPVTLLGRMLEEAGPQGSVLIGFDFPIGLPRRYAERCGFEDFITSLLQFGQGDWADFYLVAENPGQIGLGRPFYPRRPGNSSQAHLLQALGMQTIDELRRVCELPHAGRRAASPLFWTLGGQQVGKAAIIGWRDVLGPALRELGEKISIWPFAGKLFDLLQNGKIVIAETYPAEFYAQLGITFSTHRSGQKSGKRSPADRAANAPILLKWAEKTGLLLSPQLHTSIRTGFGHSPGGEDPFDAVVGLFGMLNVICKFRSYGEPPAEPWLKVEGWIMGQKCD
jgi:hypothetical protein